MELTRELGTITADLQIALEEFQETRTMPVSEPSSLELNAQELAKLLDYCGHYGYENQAEANGERVRVSCSHCGAAFHQELICHSLEPLRVTIDPDRTNEVEEFESVGDLRIHLEEMMLGI